MAKAIDSSKQILAGLLVFSFLLVILVAFQFMKKDDRKESEKPKEGFKSASTRAADCKCLPGYVPSNSGIPGLKNITIYALASCGAKTGDKCDSYDWYFVVRDYIDQREYILSFAANQDLTKIKAVFGDDWSECEKLFKTIKNKIQKDPVSYERYLNVIGFSGYLYSKDFINKYLSSLVSSNYSCQSLSDHSDKKPCY